MTKAEGFQLLGQLFPPHYPFPAGTLLFPTQQTGRTPSLQGKLPTFQELTGKSAPSNLKEISL